MLPVLSKKHEMSKFYRVCDDTGHGPYQYSSSFPRCFEMGIAHTRADHPSAYADADLSDKWADFDTHYWVFGFSDMRKLFRWFGGWLPLMKHYGYTVHVYDVPDSSVIHGRKQSMADPRNMRLIA